MKPLIVCQLHQLRRHHSGWWCLALVLGFVAILSLGVTFVAALDPGPAAARPATRQPGLQASPFATSSSSALEPVSFAGAQSSSVPGHIQATQAVSHTVFLPIVSKGYPIQVLDSPFGLQIYGREYDLANTIVEAGASWIHIPLRWAQIEPQDTTPQNYHWSASFEQGLAKLSARNMKVILTLYDNPSWAATYPAGPIDKTDPADLREFMVAAVSRYSKPPFNVKYWEIYSEPDNGDPYYASAGWGYFGNNPQGYVDVLSLLYGPIKAADPQAHIVFGGLAYDNWTETGGPFVKSFLDKVLSLGGGSYFDVMNFHYYVLFHAHWDGYGIGITGKCNYLQGILSAHKVSKPIICTEASMWSDPAHDGSDELQTRYVPQLYARTLSTDLQATVWFLLQDRNDLGAFKYGLLNPDASPKFSFDAYGTLTRQLAAATYLQTLNPAEDGTGQIEAYEFLSQGGPEHVIVAWSMDSSGHPMSIRTGQVVMVDRFGSETVLGPETDGRVHLNIGGCSDGPTQWVIGRCPVYLRFVPES
jgi:hypothetical protein